MNKKNIEINVENVSKQFKEIVALDNITVRFENARLYGLIGPAGAGKTTLFRIMLGLLNANKGAVFYNTKGNRIPFAEIQGNELPPDCYSSLPHLYPVYMIAFLDAFVKNIF